MTGSSTGARAFGARPTTPLPRARTWRTAAAALALAAALGACAGTGSGSSGACSEDSEICPDTGELGEPLPHRSR